MDYEFDIFISYRRSPTTGLWVKNHLVPRLAARLNEVSRDAIHVSCDFEMASGTQWPQELKRRLRHSRLLVAVWSADYFRSPWCMAEWLSFRAREELLQVWSEPSPIGLVYPVRYADGDHYHPDARAIQCQRDFSQLNYPDESFRHSSKYLDFDDVVREMAQELSGRLQAIPPWRPDFPIEEPLALPLAKLKKPVL